MDAEIAVNVPTLDSLRQEWLKEMEKPSDMKAMLEAQKNYVEADLKARGIVTAATWGEFIKEVRERRCPGFSGDFDVI